MNIDDAFKINPNAILIHSGILFDVFNPRLEDIGEEDIAHGLSHLCRFGGHSPKFYSVAQHSVLGSQEEGTPLEQMEFLFHDGSEAFLIDLPRPIKRQIPEYRNIENKLLELIFKRFNLRFPLSERVHEIDNKLVRFEYDKFFVNVDENFEFWTPEEAKRRFLARFKELKTAIENEKMQLQK